MASVEKLTLVIDAQNNAEAALSNLRGSLDNVKGKLESMSGAFKGMAAAGGAALAGITAIGVKSLKDYADAEAAMTIANTNIENAINSLSKAQLSAITGFDNTATAISSVKDTMDQASKAAVRLGFDDEATAQSFSKLFAITKDTSQANKDLALAMDLARNQNISLEAATSAVAKAHTGATRELKDFGVKLKEGATYAEIAAALNEKVGGSAEKAATTAKVKMEALSITMGNLSENIGSALMPAVQKLADALLPIVEKIANWVEENPKLAATILAVGAGLAGLALVIGTVGLILPAIITGFSLLAGAVTAVTWPIGLVVAAIALVVFALYELYKHWDTVVAYLTQKWEEFGKYLQLFPGFAAINAFIDLIKILWQNKEEIINAIIAKWNDFKLFFTLFLLDIQTAWQNLMSVFSTVFNAFILMFKNAWIALTGTITLFSDTVKATWGSLWNGAKDAFNVVWNYIKDAISTGAQFIMDKINAIKAAWESVKSLVGGAVSSGVTAVSGAVGKATSAVSSVFRAAGGPVNSNGSYIVGENGPELFTPDRYGSITRNSDVGGQPIVINITGNSFMGKEGIAEEISQSIMKTLMQNTKLAL